MSSTNGNSPILSVIVPVYNTERYIVQALDSISNSTLRDFEMILIDDGSTDGSPAICDRYRMEHEDLDIRVYHTANHGLSAVRNYGAKLAKGKYLIYADSDDWVEPELYERLVAAAEKYDAQAAVCGIRLYDDETGRFECYSDSLFPERLAGTVFDFRSCGAVVQGLLDCSTCNKVVLREFVERHALGFDVDCDFGEDSRYWAKFFFAAERLTLVGGRLYNYRINQKRASNCVKAKKSYDSFAETMRIIMDTMRSHSAFDAFGAEFAAYMSLQTLVAFNNVDRRRRKALFGECAQVAASAGKAGVSLTLSPLTRYCAGYVYWVLRHLPYWGGSLALLPLTVLRSRRLKALVRKLLWAK